MANDRYEVEVTKVEEAFLSKKEAYDLAARVIMEVANFRGGCNYSVVNGRLVCTFSSGGGGHNWTERKELDDATELDKAAVLLLEALRSRG